MKEYELDRDILLSLCDGSGHLSVTGALDIFMDTATLHEDAFGLGVYKMMDMGLYWIIGKNRVRFLKRPAMMDRVRVRTWFTEPSRLYGNREYVLEDKEGNPLVIGETEWLVATEGCKKIMPIKEYITPEIVSPKGRLFDDRMRKVAKDFSDGFDAGIYTVSPTDVDFVGHMNNAAYSRAVMSFIPSSELAGRGIREVEIFYSLQCKEGDALSIKRRNTETGTEFGAFLPDGSTVMTARFTYEH